MGRRVLAILLVVALGATSCGDAEDDAFVVALTGKYPPFSFFDEAGALRGFDVDVARLVAEHRGRKLRLVTTEWDGILAGLLAGKYDAIIGSMAVTPERAERVLFSKPYYRSGAQLFVHRDDVDRIRDLEALTGARVGVVLGETFEHFLRTEHPEVVAATYKSTVDIFQDMQNRRLRAFVTDRLVGQHQIKQAGMPFRAVGPLLYTEEMAIPVRPGETALAAEIDAALRSLEANGTLEALHDKWFSPADGPARATAMPTAVVAKRLAKGFAVTLLVAVLSLGVGLLLAVPLGVVLHRGRALVRLPVRALVDFIRGTPVLIQLFFVYFGLGSEAVGLQLSPLGAAVLTLSVNATAYLAEVVRSGLMAVPAGQVRAARALGLTRFQSFRHVVAPQAFRVAMPPLMNSAVALLKDTALVSVISVAEVIREAQSIISVTFEPARYYLIVAGMFFLFTYPLMKVAGVLEARMRRKGFTHA